MASGWGCQHQVANIKTGDWCRLLNHGCEPGCKGCVLYGNALFSLSSSPSNKAFERRKKKKRSDNPLGDRYL